MERERLLLQCQDDLQDVVLALVDTVDLQDVTPFRSRTSGGGGSEPPRVRSKLPLIFRSPFTPTVAAAWDHTNTGLFLSTAVPRFLLSHSCAMPKRTQSNQFTPRLPGRAISLLWFGESVVAESEKFPGRTSTLCCHPLCLAGIGLPVLGNGAFGGPFADAESIANFFENRL